MFGGVGLRGGSVRYEAGVRRRCQGRGDIDGKEDSGQPQMNTDVKVRGLRGYGSGGGGEGEGGGGRGAPEP